MTVLTLNSLNEFLVLFQMVCVIAIIAYAVTRTKIFHNVLTNKASLSEKLIISIIFGIISIYGTLSNIVILGAPVNVRDLGPIIAGLTGGPFTGVIAGLIGACFRLSMGGFTEIPCSLATFIAGTVGGLIYLANNKKFIGIKGAVICAASLEIFHQMLILLLAKPFGEALALVSQIAFPMILANVLGIFIFSYFISNLLNEKKAISERDAYLKEIERTNAELAIAHEIQVSFLPENIPEIEGFLLAVKSIPAKEVGGDFYDVITPLGKGNLGLLIADVSGKGIPAALFMALSRTISRANATWHSKACDAIKDANSMISSDAKQGMFVSLFFGIIDPKKKTLNYVNAGHNPPIIFRNNGTFETLEPTGPVLGVMPDISYDEGNVSLYPGDITIFYTDGITEAIDTGENEFGVERLIALVSDRRKDSAQDIMNTVFQAVESFSTKMPQFDDMTLMVLKVMNDEN